LSRRVVLDHSSAETRTKENKKISPQSPIQRQSTSPYKEEELEKKRYGSNGRTYKQHEPLAQNSNDKLPELKKPKDAQFSDRLINCGSTGA